MQIGIILYEDNASLRASLQHLLHLSGKYKVLGAYENCNSVTADVEEQQPDLILMDIDLPGINGIEAVKKIRLSNQTVQIMMLTVFDDNTHVYDALYAGANGYLLKKNISDKLGSSIEEVLQGGAPMSPAIARIIISSMHRGVADNDYRLTTREQEILQSLSRGNSFKLIAAELSISLETVRTHIKHIYDKLHVRSQAEAISKAFKEKLI